MSHDQVIASAMRFSTKEDTRNTRSQNLQESKEIKMHPFLCVDEFSLLSPKKRKKYLFMMLLYSD